MTDVLLREPFRAMGTLCSVATTVGPADERRARRALAQARDEVAACERALSRFDERSDLSRLNRAGGAWVEVDERLVEALGAALRARAETDGRFDPTVLPALSAAGYDRSFELLRERPARRVDGWRPGARIDLAPGRRRARLESGAGVDLGGIGKGFAAARALEALRAEWPESPGALIDLGGDIAVSGTPPGGGAWRIEVADPRAPDRCAGTLALTTGGVATSGRDTRRFGPERALHHLIDPMAGAPAVGGPLAVTVVARTAVEAEAHATALAITALAEARAYVARRATLSALLVPYAGEPFAAGPLPLVPATQPRRFVVSMPTGRLALP